MAQVQLPPPGRLIVSYIYSSVDALAESLNRLERQYGRVQCETVDYPCTCTERYAEEMGDNLRRRFFSFGNMVPRDSLPAIKKTCTRIEKQFSDQVNGYPFRTVNIDPGVVTPDNVIMSSHREFNHRIYLANGVFAEMQLIWGKGMYLRLPWTSKDFTHAEAVDFFHRVRQSFELLEEPAQAIRIGLL
jgi:hypothetical protein